MSIVDRAIEKLERDEREPGGKSKKSADTAAGAEGAKLREPDRADAEGGEPSGLLARVSVGTPSVAFGDRITIDVEKLRAAGLLPPEGSVERISDEFRRIKRPLLAGAFGKGASRKPNGNLIMISSSMPGEGKSFTSVNLALSIAQELDHTVLLVDADVAKPHISRVLELDDRPGLIDVLLNDEIDLQDVLVRTDLDRLRVMPAGPPHRQATELLASERMSKLVLEMAHRYPDRVILFDTPPLLATTEAQVMASLMGQIVLLAHSGKTPKQAVLESLEGVKRDSRVSLVLTKVNARWADEYYGGYYAYY